jgi:hypothetical protein
MPLTDLRRTGHFRQDRCFTMQVAGREMLEKHVFKVRAGWVPTHSSDLVLAPDRIQLADRNLLAADVRWIRLRIASAYHTGLKMGTTSALELGNERDSLKFSLHDVMYSSTRSNTFTRIYDLVLRFYGNLVLQEMVTTIVNDGSFTVGKWRFTKAGLQVPRRRLMVSGDLEMVPWGRVVCSVADGAVHVSNAVDPKLCGEESLWTPNAPLVHDLVAYVQKA